MLFSKRLVLSYLRVIGCLCCAFIVPKSDKFSERTTLAILMGYSELQKGYILFGVHTRRYFMNKDKISKEEVFPFQQTRKDAYSSVLMGCSLEKTTGTYIFIMMKTSLPITFITRDHEIMFYPNYQWHHRSLRLRYYLLSRSVLSF